MSVLIKKFETDEFDSEFNRTVHREYIIEAVPYDEDEKVVSSIEIKKKTYYLWPQWGNHYTDYIVLEMDSSGRIEIHRYTVGENKITYLAYLKLDDFAETPGFLWREEVESINNVEDLKRYLEYMRDWLKDFIDTLNL